MYSPDINFSCFGQPNHLYGFTPTRRIDDLRANGTADLPDVPGVYMVFTPEGFLPDFLCKNIARPFRKKKSASICCELLRDKHWVSDSRVIYIGKAGGGNKSTLRSRIKQFIDSADGGHASNQHWGGRFIWQLGNIGICRFAILPLSPEQTPSTIENMLLRKFDIFFNTTKMEQRILPFANLRW